METLPSFSGLTAFLAVTRHGTLTRAAQSLNVSQPAISRRIALLETELGTPLYDRSHKPLQLTEAGQQLGHALTEGLGRISNTVAQIRESHSPRSVSVAGPSGFIAFWLIPRLGALHDACPGVTVRILSHEHGNSPAAADLIVRFDRLDNPGGGGHKILGETVFAAASPLYLARNPVADGLADLSGHVMLGMEPGRHNWYDWPSWFKAVDKPMPARPRMLEFNAYAMLINAALAGQGLCLCWSGLLDSFLETGALVRLSGPEAHSNRGYIMAPREPGKPRAAVDKVFSWIVSQSAG
jgi:LysR family glycine cleavage system transcriptional activator